MIFVIIEIVCIPTGTSIDINESQYIVSRPRPGSDPPFRSDRELGCDSPTCIVYGMEDFVSPLAQNCSHHIVTSITHHFKG